VKALINPALITWARQSAGFTTAEAATRLGVDEGRLAAWEAVSAADAPSIPQLRKIAALFRRPLAVFYMATAPEGFVVMRDLRRLPGAGARRFSPRLQMEIRAVNERRELALELATDLEQQLSKFSLSAAVGEDPELVGARVRATLGVTTELQGRWRDSDGRAGFNAWRTRIEDVGALVFQSTRFSTEEASGFAIAGDILPIVVVNRNDTLTRRTFSLLHELAHLMIRISAVSDLETDAARPPEDQPIEVFCNQVAAAALMPKDALLKDSRVIARGQRSESWSDDELSDLARQFNVSREAMLRRLLTFDRTTLAFYGKKRTQYNDEWATNKALRKAQPQETEMKRNMPQETVSNFGRPFVRMLLGNYYQDRITLSEVSGYLGLKVKHIPKLEQAARLR
jgi:Zn-dependent peptidase ImmA (M78 family)/transcriptional regulator with XRE-family HTH domain